MLITIIKLNIFINPVSALSQKNGKLCLNLDVVCIRFKSIELDFKETLETMGMKHRKFNERESNKN